MTRRRAVQTAVLLLGVAVVAWLLLDDPERADTPAARRGDATATPKRPELIGLDARVVAKAKASRRQASPGANEPPARNADPIEALSPRASLCIEAIEALSGRPIQASWNLGSGSVMSGPFPSGAVVDEAALARSREAADDSIARWNAAFLASGESRADALLPGAFVRMRYTVRPPAGYVLDDPTPRIVSRLAAGIDGALVVVPVWRERILDLHVMDTQGQSIEDAAIVLVSSGGRIRGVDAEVQAPGELRVRGIPHMPGETLRAVLDWGRGDGVDEIGEYEEEIEVEEGEALAHAQVVTTIPADLYQPWQMEVRLEGKSAPSCWAVETDNDLAFEESFGESEGIGSERRRSVSARVRVLGHDGTPAAGAVVDDVQTNARGEALLTGLRPGPHTIVMTAAGRFGVRRAVELSEDGTLDVTLREPIGARLEVIVTDAKGRPRPCAGIQVQGRVVFDVIDGVQRLDMFTDAHGRRVFARVEPGPAKICATWGALTGAQEVELRDAGTATVRIVVK